MARPVVPISRTDYYVRGAAIADGGLAPFGVDGDGQPLSSALVHDELASSLAHLWLAQGQHYVNFFTPSAGTPISFTSDDTAGKGNHGAGTLLRSFEWTCRLLADGRPEPVRVVVRAKKASGGDSNFWIRCVLRWASREPVFPWPLPNVDMLDGWNVGQANFTSSSLAETEIGAVENGLTMNGILQMHPTRRFTLPEPETHQREDGITTADDWEPVRAASVALDVWGGFTSGTSGAPELHGLYGRAASYGAKDAT